MTKNHLRITAKPHAHLQTLIKKNPTKFQKDPPTIVGGVVFKRVDPICDGQAVRQTDGHAG